MKLGNKIHQMLKAMLMTIKSLPPIMIFKQKYMHPLLTKCIISLSQNNKVILLSRKDPLKVSNWLKIFYCQLPSNLVVLPLTFFMAINMRYFILSSGFCVSLLNWLQSTTSISKLKLSPQKLKKMTILTAYLSQVSLSLSFCSFSYWRT